VIIDVPHIYIETDYKSLWSNIFVFSEKVNKVTIKIRFSMKSISGLEKFLSYSNARVVEVITDLGFVQQMDEVEITKRYTKTSVTRDYGMPRVFFTLI
jgi:hypothetical protein